PGCQVYLAALGRLGRDAEAAVVRKRLMGFDPKFRLDRFTANSAFEDVSVTERLADGMRRAGIAESISA
ncbi:MAG: hypothetical protein M3N26_03500, partial [Pseudomonadota bacterium]|nr:hypothetical protein [Pseudomonadota bacterium]